MNKNIELLAPVGSKESLYAAINNGANAVYLGGKLFNARQFASNFDYEDLKEAVALAHFNNVKVYVTVNILIRNSEIKEILDYIKFLYDIDVDAIIVQDIGLANLVRKLFPDLDLHASTQMTINNLQGVKFLQDLGFKRVVLARETPMEEIKRIKENTNMEIESFVHGALCVSYSGQCLMSSLIGGRSGNRGTCAQPCRMAYDLVKLDGKAVKTLGKSHIISTRDLNTLEHLDEIIESGVTSLKIEGRMKRPEYVATIVKNYRKALDRGKDSITKTDKKDVSQIFNREFTKGIGLGDFGESFVSRDRPDNRGILLGRVIKVDNKTISFKLEEDLKVGDGIEFYLSQGKYKGEKSKVSGEKGSIIKMGKLGPISKDSLVYKTSSIDLLEAADISLKIVKRPIDMKIDVEIGKFPKLQVQYGDINLDVLGDFQVETAGNMSLDPETIRTQLGKLGNTNYYLDDLEINLEENAFLPLGVLNKLRRLGVEKLDSILLNFNNRKIVSKDDFQALKENILSLEGKEKNHKKKITVKISNRAQFYQIDLNKVDRIYLDFYEDIDDILNSLREKNIEVYIVMAKILYAEDFDSLKEKLDKIKDLIDGVSVSNLGTLKYIRDNYDLKIHGDMGLNIFNSYTIDYLNSLGLETMNLSPELNLREIREIDKLQSENLEAVVYGYLPSMVLATCPLAIVKGCKDNKDCGDCYLAKGYGLKDRMDMIFPLVREHGYTVLYNALPIMVLDSLDDIYKSGISFARIDFTLEEEGIREIQGYFYDYANNQISKEDIKVITEEFRDHRDITKGHYYRGVI